MKKIMYIFFVIVGFTLLSFGQKSDSLKLMEAEIPAGYSLSSNLICKTVHASSFYNQTGLYASFSGNLIEKDFSGEAFHKGLVWGGAEKSSKQKPDKFFIKERFLIIRSFYLGSEIKKNSK